MKFEFIIRDIKTWEEPFYSKLIPEEDYAAVKSAYENKMKELNDKDLRLLINKLDDEGEFLEVIQ